MAVARADVVRPPVVVEGQLELRVLARGAEEVVRRLLLAVADDVELAPELEAEGFVKGPAPGRVGDADHRVEIAGHV